MKYTSEHMNEILKSESAKQIIDQVSPIYARAFYALWLCQVIGVELDDLRKWTEEFGKQVVPQTATWTLDYWEQNYCIPYDLDMSMQKRRDRIISRIRDRAPMNPYTLGKIACLASANAEAKIEENTGVNKFTVWITSMPDATAKNKVITAVDQAKPAHLVYDVKYMQNAVGNQYFGGVISMYKKFDVRQV